MKHADAPPPCADTPHSLGVMVSDHWIAADELYSKRHVIPAGIVLGQHTHPYDHASALISGTVRVEVGDVVREFTGPRILLIAANQPHRITSLSDVVWHCIHIPAQALASADHP